MDHQFYAVAAYYFLQIFLPAIIVAWQEIEIEGPFGWGSCLFTHRYPSTHWYSRIFRTFSGKDKWATGFNLSSSLVWLTIFLAGPWHMILWSGAPTHSFWLALSGQSGLAIASWVIFLLTEDYLWFVLNPYYGTGRFRSSHIPWLRYFDGPIPNFYFFGFCVALITAMASCLPTGNYLWTLGWCLGLVMVLAALSAVTYLAHRYIRLKPLSANWEEKIKYIIIQRSPFPNEAAEPDEETKAWIVPQTVFAELKKNNLIIPLDDFFKKERPPH